MYFPLHPNTPTEGLLLKDLFAGRGFDLEAMHARMKGLMDAEGLPYERRTHTYNSRLAQELAKWADSQPDFEAIHSALYRAYFVEGRNIGNLDVLVDVAQSVGLPANEAREVLVARAESVGLPADEARAVIAERRFKAEVDADWAKSRQYGVTGVPTFVAGGYGVVGAQPYEALAQLLDKVGVPKRA